MSLSGPARAWAWTQSNISGDTRKWVFVPIQHKRAWKKEDFILSKYLLKDTYAMYLLQYVYL